MCVCVRRLSEQSTEGLVGVSTWTQIQPSHLKESLERIEMSLILWLEANQELAQFTVSPTWTGDKQTTVYIYRKIFKYLQGWVSNFNTFSCTNKNALNCEAS